MIIQLENGETIDGAMIQSAVLRNSLTPIPFTFEATIRIDETVAEYLLEDKEIKVGRNLTPVKIKHVKDDISTVYQNNYVQVRNIIALHSDTFAMSHVAEKGIFLEQTNLSTVYQACGGKSQINKDFVIEKFYCFKGEFPSVQIQEICQEHGGVVRWMPDSNALEFTRIYDLFNQEPTMGHGDLILADNTKKSGLLERHEVPSYVSTAPDGSFIKGNFDKARNVVYRPDKTQAELNSMTNVILNAKSLPSRYAPEIHSGAIIQSGETKFVVITAAHAFRQPNGAGTGENSCSVFWLGVKQ